MMVSQKAQPVTTILSIFLLVLTNVSTVTSFNILKNVNNLKGASGTTSNLATITNDEVPSYHSSNVLNKNIIQSIMGNVVKGSSILAIGASLTMPQDAAFAAGEAAEIRGTKLTPLNSLTFQYRGAEFGGLDGTSITGPSITYKDFLDKLSTGDVTMVEFLAPSGDEAYATLKSTGERIRIGEGFPIEQYDGWSSPAFAIRSVKEKGVPYKFIVPGLDKYKPQ